MKEGKFVELRVLGLGKGAEIGAAVALELDQKMFIPIHDHIGNVACLLDAVSGVVVETYRHSSFGEEMFDGRENGENSETREKAISPWRFSSKRVDDESGLVYFGRRYYAPELGRWVTPDPIGRDGGPNLYAYVMNSPLTHFDLYGLFGVGNPQFAPQGNIFERAFNFICNLIQMPGHIVSFVGRHILPVPYVNHLVEFGGHCLRGQNPWAYDWSQHQSGLLVHKGNNDKPDHLRVSTNGLFTAKNDHLSRMAAISAENGGVTVYGLHSAYNGVILEVAEVLVQKLGIPTNAQITANRNMHNLLNMQGPLKGQTTVFVDAHSRGTETIYHFDRSLRDKMDVTAFAPARMAGKGHYKGLENYVCPLDFVPFSSPVGYFQAVKNGNVHFLPSTGNSLMDHFYDNQSFTDVRNIKGEYYQQQFGKAA